MPVGTSAMVALANITLGSNAASVTFSSISGTYRDLVLVIEAKITTAGAGTDILMNFNGDATGANYAGVYMAGFGSSTGSGTGQNQAGYVHGDAAMLNTINVLDYSATDKHKTSLIRYGNSANFAAAKAYRWANTSAITSVALVVSGTSFAAGSTFALYGVSA